jgi:hypothetical protein
VGRQAAEARYYARSAAVSTGDLAELYYEQINEMEDTEQRDERDRRLDEACQNYAEGW